MVYHSIHSVPSTQHHTRSNTASSSPLTPSTPLHTSTYSTIRTISIRRVSNDWYATLDMLKESCRIASSVNWSDVDLSQFQGLMESMRQADLKNWSLDQVQFADLCSSLNQFFTQTGLIHSQSNVQQNVCHGAMHPTKPSQHIGTGHHGAMNQQHMMPSQAFQMRRSLPPDDIQDDFDWDSIV
ncbi:hypothetical protein J1605_012355 [Eschrichtius robustus]|uniref:Forkhead box protein J3 n=1 Tax=Eschrichtius robustus TaxID=9764 RepID=A0AB34GH69_ESCRO|nr:hypothetical protein J1605_012355 [Eschrichtius robustus]